MKIKIICCLLTFCACMARAQDQKYYEFGWNGLYGVVDSAGNEIVPPTYQWKAYALDSKSPFLAFNSKEKGGMAIHSVTGKQQHFDFFEDARVLNIGSKEYLYAYDAKNAFLIDKYDLEKHLILPKKYKRVKQTGDYLVGLLSKEEDVYTVDIIESMSLSIKKSNQKMIQFREYLADRNAGLVYVITQPNATIFLDKNLKYMSTAKEKLADFESVQYYLQQKHQITIMQQKSLTHTSLVAPPPAYPYMKSPRISSGDDFVVYNVYYSDNDFTPFFKFSYKTDNPPFKLYGDPYQNKVEARIKKDSNNELYFLFYTDIKRKKVIFPQKYGDIIGLQILTGYTDTQEGKDSIRHSNSKENPDVKKTGDPSLKNNSNTIFKEVEKQAEFPGGIRAFQEFFINTFSAPNDSIAGRMVIDFVVEPDGSLSNIKIVKDLGSGVAEEVKRVLKQSPKWTPAIKDGKYVRSQFRFPMTIM